MDRRTFFTKVFGKSTGWAVLTTLNKFGKPAVDEWFNYPEDLTKMVNFCDKTRGDIFFSPNVYNSRSRTKVESKETMVFAADADACLPNNFLLAPSLIVRTSAGRYHTYWFIDNVLPASQAAVMNRRIAQAHKHQGCDVSFANAAKLLRVPGTPNSKHEDTVVKVAAVDTDDTPPFTLTQFETIYPAVDDLIETGYTATTMPTDMADYVTKNLVTTMSKLPNTLRLSSFLGQTFVKGKRSEFRFKILCELINIGLNDYEIMTVAWHDSSNKYNGPGADSRGLSGLWTEYQKAKSKTVMSAEPKYVDDVFASENVGKEEKQVEFLTETEISNLKPTFIDKWVAWAATKTDAPHQYHQSAAMQLLSTVFSEFGHAVPKQGNLGLNLWFVTLGTTTVDRKSTSKKYMLNMLKELYYQDKYDYFIGSNFSPNGLLSTLQERPNRASLLSIDECQGFFKTLFTQSYMESGAEDLTEYYDGSTSGRLRSTGVNKSVKPVDTHFLLYLTGILDETTKVLTKEHYKSGFLARFIPVISSKNHKAIISMPEQQGEEEAVADVVFNEMRDQLALFRAKWATIVPEDETMPVRATDAAWKRWQEFGMEVESILQQLDETELVSPAARRMVASVLKLACLLALSDGYSNVDLPHMLSAIFYAKEWYKDITTMASMVAESAWEREVGELEVLVLSRMKGISYGKAYDKFKYKRPNEFREMVESLVQRGVISILDNNGVQYLKAVNNV